MNIEYKVKDVNDYFKVIEIENKFLDYLIDINIIKFNRGISQGFMKINLDKIIINGSVTDDDKLFLISNDDFNKFKKIIDNISNTSKKTIIENKILDILDDYISEGEKPIIEVGKYILEVLSVEYKFRYNYKENKLFVWNDYYNDVEDLQNFLNDIKEIEEKLNKLNEKEEIDYLYWN